MVTRLSADLDEANLISLGSYDVLVQLSENNGKLRLKELVNRVVLSQPGLSRRVANMEGNRLVERLNDPADGRGVIVHITRAGRAALRRASVLHIAGIEREFTSQITDHEAAVLAAVFARLEAAGDNVGRRSGSDGDRAPTVDDTAGPGDPAEDRVGLGQDRGGPLEDRGLPLQDRGVSDRRKAAQAARQRRSGADRGPGSRN